MVRTSKRPVFLPLRYGGKCASITNYENHFKHCGDAPIVMEATPGYFDGGSDVATEIKRQLPGVRIVIALRDPAERLLSFFAYQKAQLRLPPELSFRQYLADCLSMDEAQRSRPEFDAYWGIDGGQYIRYLPSWQNVFGSAKLKVVFFESLIRNPAAELANLCKWLRIDDHTFDGPNFNVENRTVPYRYAGLQRLAISANRTLEPMLRRVPLIKRGVRSMYYALNSKSQGINANEHDKNAARNIYASHNRAVRDYLRQHGYDDLPGWLQAID